MGLSSSKSKTETDQNTTQNATTTPVLPDFAMPAFDDYTSRIGAFGNMDPNSFVAGAAPLQRMAWDNAGSLADWQPQARLASQTAQQAGSALAPNAGQASLWSPSAGSASGYQAPSTGPASLVSARGYDTSALGNAQGYAAPRVGAPIGATAQGVQPFYQNGTTLGPAATSQASNASAADIASKMGAYQNPYQQQVVNASMADFDQQAGQSRAAMEAAGARNGAFGGSRFGIGQAQLEGELSRARNSSLSGLLSHGFETAAQLGGQDAGFAQQASLFNAGNQTQNNQFNAGARNQFGLAQAGMDQERNANNAGIANQAAQFSAGAQNQASLFNAGQANQMGLAQAGLDENAARYGADAGNQFALSRFGAQNDANRFGAEAANSAAGFNAGAQNQFSLANAGFQQDAGQFNAGAQNQMGLANLGYANQAGQYNAGAQNQMSQFNAGLQGDQLGRQLQSAGMLGDLANQYGAGVRSDLGTMAQLGDQQRGIEQQYAMAGPAQLQMMGNLYGTTPWNVLTGQNVSGTSNMTGTNTTTASPSLFNQMLSAAQIGAAFI